MEWKTEEFGASHEGRAGAVLADGSEPTPMYFDAGSGGGGHSTSDWWVYDGTLGAPRASELRASCSCGWRGTSRYPIDWSDVPEDCPYAYDTSGPYDDWEQHIAEVEAQTVPLPDELTDLLHQVIFALSACFSESRATSPKKLRRLAGSTQVEESRKRAERRLRAIADAYDKMTPLTLALVVVGGRHLRRRNSQRVALPEGC
ncbi:hypothetical protein ACWC2K_18245 [Streptomyces chattanoogensis]